MASTFVNDLRLTELGTGDGSGTWGNTTNTNFELIGEAFGYGTEAITTNANTHTSTVADGTSNQARHMYIKYTGALDSDCTITIAPNDISRVHFIENATTDSGSSGPYNIIISQGSGANVTIPNGQVAVVYLDGAGSGAAVVNALTNPLLAGDITASGTLGATGDTSSGDTAAIGFTSTEGIIITGQGSTNDVTIKNDADTQVMGVLTGTTTSVFAGVVKTDDTTDASSTTDGSLQTDGGLSVVKDAVIGNDLKLLSDAAVIHFGADSEITLTHVHDTGLTLGGTTPTLTIGDAGAEDTKIVFDGNAQDFYIGLDDSEDDLVIGLGSAVGTTPALSIDENLLVTVEDDITVTGRAVGSQDADQATSGAGGTITMNLADHNNFEISVGHTVTLTFSNQTVGQTGCIFLDKTSADAVSFNTIVAINASSQSALSTAGVYMLTYMVKAASGTGSILVSASGALTADG